MRFSSVDLSSVAFLPRSLAMFGGVLAGFPLIRGVATCIPKLAVRKSKYYIKNVDMCQ